MRKLVIKKLILQFLIVILVLLIPYLIVNKVFGTDTIKSTLATSPRTDSNEIIMLNKIEKGKNSLKPKVIITSQNGFVLFEKEGYINPYRINENKILLFYMDITLTKRSLFVLNTDKYELSDISSQITFPSDPNATLTINSNDKTNSFCYYFKDSSYKVSCYSYEAINNKITFIDVSEVNTILNNIKSNKYFLDSNYGYFLDTNTYKLDEYVIGFSEDNSRIQPLNLLSFKVESNKVIIKSNNFKDHVIDEKNMSEEYDNRYKVYGFENLTPITLYDRTKSDGIIYSSDPKYSEDLYLSECNDSYSECPTISNPIIGSQFIEYKGIKYLEWLSTYNYNNIQAGLLGNNKTIYARINNFVYLIDIQTRNVYKLNNKEDFTNTIVMGVGYY